MNKRAAVSVGLEEILKYILWAVVAAVLVVSVYNLVNYLTAGT